MFLIYSVIGWVLHCLLHCYLGVWDMCIPETQDEGSSESSKQQSSSIQREKKSNGSPIISYVRAVKHTSSSISSLCRISGKHTHSKHTYSTLDPPPVTDSICWCLKLVLMSFA